MDRVVTEVEQVPGGEAGALDLVDRDGGRPMAGITAHHDEGHVAFEPGRGLDDRSTGATTMTPWTWDARRWSSVVVMSLPDYC